ncbi:uncharacterized protein LOC117111504 [Anneissia japonica]|uniref:uncharacterized protein LOC117111504 n=1 Tax=Anneissia japonica TaxID=1529436 RepID=UPI0014258DD1|nr:uncharacterized protein LOC117111504 [Anneissia japonica]
MAKSISIEDALKKVDLIHLLSNFEREKITTKEVQGLTDPQLSALGVSTIGDRHRLRNSCKQTACVFHRFMPAKQSPYPQKKGKSKTQSWTRKMVCLSRPDADTTPRSEEKQLLIDVGLGEKTVFIPDINISPEQFCQVLYTYFAKLQDAGGFELLTCIGSERKLVTIRGKYTPQNIKDRLDQGRIYIRPIQNSLNLDPVDSGVDVDSGLMQKCSKCQKEFPFNILKKHIERCSRMELMTCMIQT